MPETFGERIRRIRTEKNLGLRETAKKAGISPTFLSRVESAQERAVPAEDTIRRLAEAIGDDFNELMALAGRVPSDVKDYVSGDPKMPEFLRLAREQNVSAEDLIAMLRGQGKR